MLLFVFSAGVLVGVAAHYLWSKRRTVSVFSDSDTEAADELRSQATKAVARRIENRKSRILQVAREQGRITNDGVEDLFCISDRTASEYLRQLTSENKLTRQGANRGIYYLPTKE